MQRLLLVRHGVTDWNREGRFQGRMDPPLADDGRAEARLLGDRLRADPDLRPRRLVTSALSRARQTAEIIAAGAPVAEDPRWMELGQGEWEGLTHTQLATEDAERYAAWRAHAGKEQPPGAETIESAMSRVGRALPEALAGDSWPLCIVSHGGTLRIAARQLLGLGPLNAWALDLDNASLSVLTRESDPDPWKLERWNDTAHLLGRGDLHVDESEGEPLAL